MRLRYLHLPRCGPLVDVAIVFGQEGMLFGWSPDDPARRKGAINFVVGVNGTGKSSLLRAIYQTFRALKTREHPAQPITLAWDWHDGSREVTVVYHFEDNWEKEFFAVLPLSSIPTTKNQWRNRILALTPPNTPKKGRVAEEFAAGGRTAETGLLQSYLPRRVAAYTSGAESLWQALDLQDFDTLRQEDGTGDVADDRPPGWSIEREWDEERPARIADIISRSTEDIPPEKRTGQGIENATSITAIVGVLQKLEPLKEISKKVIRNQIKRSSEPADPCFRVRAEDLRLAAHALAMWQAANELGSAPDAASLREKFQAQLDSNQPGEGARRVLNKVDWLYPTHLSISYHDAADRVSKSQREQLLCLCALADEVVEQPLGRFRIVISLGRRDLREFAKSFADELDLGFPSQRVEALANRVTGSATGAEAVLRVFSESTPLDGTMADFFKELKSWQESGLLEDITLTVKRLRPKARDGNDSNEPTEDVIVLYDQLSDGEQMLLARTALLFLLRGQDNTLLLLDEPETHFNDTWKREVIDLVDDNILKTTFAQVVVATHTSIALTDVFSSEIVLLRRDRKTGAFYEAIEPIETFGATPEDILRDIFESGEIIGQRAAQILDLVLIAAGNPNEANRLWSSGDFSGPPLDRLWQAAQRVPHSFESPKDFGCFLKSIWNFTRRSISTTANPTLLDTLRVIERKLGPGHYQFEFRRRIHAQQQHTNAPPH